MKNQGFPHDLFIGKPVIGICNTWSEVTPCNAHFRELAEHIKAGVLEANEQLVIGPGEGRARLVMLDNTTFYERYRDNFAATVLASGKRDTNAGPADGQDHT